MKSKIFLVLIVSLSLLALVVAISYIPISKDRDSTILVLAHITDSHSDSGGKTANTNRSVLWIRDYEEIDFVIHTGDLTQNGDVQAEWEEIYQIMHQLDGSQGWSVLAGNHDNLTYFKNTFGDVINNTKTYGNFAFITMSVIYPHERTITDSQFEWLGQQLSLYSDYNIIIGHHWLHSDPSEGHNYSVSPSVEPLFYEHLKNYPNVVLALSGHNHENDYEMYFQNETYVHFLVSKPVLATYVRLFYFFSNGSILVKTYNVHDNQYSEIFTFEADFKNMHSYTSYFFPETKIPITKPMIRVRSAKVFLFFNMKR